MSTYEEINKAISAHGQWKHILRTAIDTGECESTPDRVKTDHYCSFGKWLYDRIDPSVKGSRHYDHIVDLHAKFHVEAGKILELALNGHKDDAIHLMELGSDFSSLSSQLTVKLQEWQEILGDA